MDAETRERIAVARRWLELRPDRTHWHGCWRDHGGCASLICLNELEVVGSGLDALVPELARLRAELAEARVQLAAERERSTWRSIETAPKDGTQIIVTNGTLRLAVRWWHGVGWSDNGRHDLKWGPVTHWMPLPAAPSAADPDKEG